MSRGAPTGRNELLRWINQQCGRNHPTIESLRDGTAYCAVIEACLNRAAEGQTGALVQRAKLCSSIMQKVEWDVSFSATGSERSDAAHDTLQTQHDCEHNFHVLQDILRRCLPRDHTIELDVKRLATGKLQEHIRVLQWLHQFQSKILRAFHDGGLDAKITEDQQRKSDAFQRSSTAPTSAAQPPVAYEAQRYESTAPQHAAVVVGTDSERLRSLAHQLEELEGVVLQEDPGEDGAADVRRMLDERDILWRTLVTIDHAVHKAASEVPSAGRQKAQRTQLLLDLCKVFGHR